MPLARYFPEPAAFPFFVQPMALNAQDPARLVFWANGTASHRGGFYAFHIGANVTKSEQIRAPGLELATPAHASVLAFVSGGTTAGKADPGLLVGISNTHLYARSARTGGRLVERRLPATFAMPVTLGYNASDKGSRILGPLTHASTVSLAVAASDSDVIAVTGWASVSENSGPEHIFLSTDGGITWHNLTANLREASGVVGRVRPGGLLIVDLLENKARAVLVGTSNGVLVTYVHLDGPAAATPSGWSRFGESDEFPLVLTKGLSYEHYSDTLVAATFGRGVYTIHGAKARLLDHRASVQPGFARVPESSSAHFFPPQHV